MNEELGKVPQENSDSEMDNDKSILQWRCHPVRRRPRVSVAVSVFIVLVGIMVYYATDHSQIFTTLALVVMFASLIKFYFPTSYKLTDKKVIIKTTTQTITKDWSIYRSFYPDKNGVLLSPFTRHTRLENFRGLYIMFSGNRDEVVEFVKDRIGSKVQDRKEESTEKKE